MFIENDLLYKHFEIRRKNGSIAASGTVIVDSAELLALYDEGHELAALDSRIPELLAEREAAQQEAETETAEGIEA